MILLVLEQGAWDGPGPGPEPEPGPGPDKRPFRGSWIYKITLEIKKFCFSRPNFCQLLKEKIKIKTVCQKKPYIIGYRWSLQYLDWNRW